jgi:hypothetical protein
MRLINILSIFAVRCIQLTIGQGNAGIGTLVNRTYVTPTSTLRSRSNVTITPTVTPTSTLVRFSSYSYSSSPTGTITVSPSSSSSSSPSVTPSASVSATSTQTETYSMIYPNDNSFSSSPLTSVSNTPTPTIFPTSTPIVVTDISMTITPYMSQGLSPTFTTIQTNDQTTNLQAVSVETSVAPIVAGSVVGLICIGAIITGSFIYSRRQLVYNTPVFSSSKYNNESVVTKNPINYISSNVLPGDYSVRNSVHMDSIRVKITI